MGELAVSDGDVDVLVTMGLGSCIGLALLDRARGAAGLAHVVLPDSRDAASTEAPAKFADAAVPALAHALATLGSRPAQMEAVLVGGARMFAFPGREGVGLDVGARNDAAVTAALAAMGIPVRARATGGTKGRTVRVHVQAGAVTVREAGSPEEQLYGTAPLTRAA